MSDDDEEVNKHLIEAFSEVLRSKRRRAELSQDEVAARAKMHRTYLAKLETAKNQPTLTKMFALAKAVDDDLPSFISDVIDRWAMKRSAAREEPEKDKPRRSPALPAGNVGPGFFGPLCDRIRSKDD